MSANRRLILKIGAVLERFIIFFHLLLYRKGLDFQHRRRSLSEYRVERYFRGYWDPYPSIRQDRCLGMVNSVNYSFVNAWISATVMCYNLKSFDPEHLLKTFSDHKVTFTSLVPTHEIKKSIAFPFPPCLRLRYFPTLNFITVIRYPI
jgi:hypothetical protein